ncbi:MAG TPA: hypothetical protein VN706_25100 [Gemmatimonadaceae bacterium]|nr:hypothetical protein [Gemmatimonadaceae bacterium]
MNLVQLLLPLFDNEGKRQPEELFRRVRGELTERFGGLTEHTRAPAHGLWQDDDTGRTNQDDIVVYEVMVDDIDRDWWRRYRNDLEGAFRQKELVIRAQPLDLL